MYEGDVSSQTKWEVHYKTPTILASLLQFGPLEWREATEKPLVNKTQPQARFTKESHAREAVEGLNNEPLPFSNTTRLKVQLVTSTMFKVPTLIFFFSKQLIHNPYTSSTPYTHLLLTDLRQSPTLQRESSPRHTNGYLEIVFERSALHGGLVGQNRK